ncbi:MAG: hypothetical protein ACR2P1_02720, partial [Pseudomonadales bacterium]
YTWAYIWRAHIEHARGNLAEAIAAMHKCVTIDPASESNSAYLGLLYLELEDSTRAQAWFEHSASLQGDSSSARLWQRFVSLAVEQSNPEVFIKLTQHMSRIETSTYSLVPHLHAAQVQMGVNADSTAMLARHHPTLMRDIRPTVRIANARTAVALIHLLREQGEEKHAQALLESSLNTAALFPAQFAWMGLDAELLALAGRPEEARAALQNSFDSGWRAKWWMLERSPALAPLRDEAGFKELLQSVKARVAAQRELLRQMEQAGKPGAVPVYVHEQ